MVGASAGTQAAGVKQPPPGASSDPRPAEFDAYARGYDAGMDDPLKRLLGASADQYLAVKVRWLRDDLNDFGSRPVLLDFGCGEGAFLRQWATAGDRDRLYGCDVSRGMLEEALERWHAPVAPPDLRSFDGARAPFDDDSMDVSVACAVFHHIAPANRAVAYSELLRVLRPGGRVYVFEHNPLNPLTRNVVRRTPIDRNTVLLRAREVLAGLRQAGAIELCVRYLHFTPPRLQFLYAADALLGWLPLGAGYVVRGEKP